MEIVFGFAEKGILKRAKSEGYLTSDHSGSILSLNMGLDIGDIQKSPVDNSRRHLIEESFFSDQWDIPNSNEFLEHWEKIQADFDTFLEMANSGTSVRIWYSNAPGSLCGYMYAVTMLSKFNCRISAVHLPCYGDGESLTPLIDWGNIQPESLPSYLKDEREVPLHEQKRVSALWEKLREENAPLRANVNGYLIGVPKNFYDSLIFSKLDSSPFEVADLILSVFKSFPLAISDYIIAERLKELLRIGILKIHTKKTRFYNSILQKL